MKTKLFILAMLASVAASAQVTNIVPVSADYTNKTVSFRVWWNAGSRDATHLSKVWVWVDYITVNSNNTTSGNSWTRATVSSASPTTSVSYDGSNRQGFWLQGNSGSYSATVTVQLTNVPAKFNWCAYVSDYSPNVTAANGTYTFKGTPPFTLIASDGTTTQTITGTTLVASALTITPTTIRDKTACPGVFCIYSGRDLYIDATHLCQQRASGAKNWEAWIKDTRDNELYRIVYMPDNKWWLAQNVKIASYNGRTADRKWTICNKDECGYGYISRNTVANWGGTSGIGANIQGVCPPGWVLPLYTDMMTMFQAISPTISYTEWSNSTWNLNAYRANSATVAQALRSKGSPHCSPSVDTYGWASEKVCTPEENSAIKGEKIQLGQHESRTSYWYMDCYGGNGAACNYLDVITCAYENVPDVVRCFRQL